MTVLFRLLAQLPLLVLQALGALAGTLLWITHSSRRRVAERNLALCLPQRPAPERRRIARRALVSEMRTYLETPLAWLGPAWRVRRLVREHRGLEVFDAAIRPGRGMLLLTLHMGSFEAAAIPLSERYRLAGIYKPQKGALDALALRGRGRFGGLLIPAIGGNVRETALPLLAQGIGLYFMPDQDPPAGRGVFVPFFGVPAHTPVLIARLARETAVPVVWLWVERLSWGRGFVAHFSAGDPAIHDPDPVRSATAMNRDLERLVLECPEQYWWGYKRFRRQPPGMPDLYR